MKTVACVLLLAAATTAVPVSQPVYPTQYISAQQLQQVQPHIQYAAQPQFLTSQPAYQALPQRSPPPPPPPPQNPPSGITQLLLPSAADRQIQKAAHSIAGPDYAQQVQALQLQGLAGMAQLAAQRRAQVTAQRLALRQQQVIQPQPQTQYLQEIQPAPSARPQLQYVSQGRVGGHAAAPPPPPPQDAQPEDDFDHNPNYQFGFDVKDDYYTNYQNRKEERNGNKISGSYSVVDSDGFLRTVTYTADPKEGFKAEVNRQPTDIVVKIPKPILPPLKQQQQQYLEDAPIDNRAHLQGQKQRLVYQYQ